ncbi:hypothetical protein ACHAWO_007379 [Cyclotella atomus]|uniref:Chromo domain-containing protein n=1 Tax=Cyclotella atomus TaxID=382360 RepID=A0ABD3PK40_9STRA
MARTRQARDSQSDTGTQQDANHPGSARSSEELRPRGDGSSISETKINNNRNSQEATASSNRSSYRAEQDFQVSNRSSSFKAENQGHHQGYNSQNDRSRRNHDPPRYRHVSHHGHGSNRHYEGSRRSYDSQGFRRGGSQRNHDPRRDRAYYDSRDHRNRYGGDERGDRRRPRDERGTRFHYDKDDRGERYRESRKRNERAENDIRDSPPRHHRGPSKRPKVEDELVELESEARKKRLELEMIQDEIKIQEGKQKLSALKSQSGVQVGETAVAAVAVREASVTSVSNSRGAAAAATDTVTLESDDDLFSTASDEDLTSRANDPVDVDEDYEPNVGEISATKKSRPKAKREEVVGPYEDYKPSGESRAAGKRGAKKKPRRKSTKTKKKKEDNQSDGYSEKSLMSRYIPTIIDHSLVCGKFLVRWDKSDGSFTESPCTSWLDIESFVFPSLAKEYLIRVTKEKTCDDDKSALMKLARKFEKVETDEKDSNMIRGLDANEGLDLAEIDFAASHVTAEPLIM